jgi:hypothetical protein
VILSEFSLSLICEGKEKLVPYASILSVRLKKSGKKFSTIIKPSDQPEVCISSAYVISNSQEENRSTEYATFVRVLHYHLREKSMAYYVCGNNLQNILFLCCALVIASFGLPYLMGNLSAYHRNLIALALSFINLTLIAIANWRHFPNVYKPDHIPAQFLPAV